MILCKLKPAITMKRDDMTSATILRDTRMNKSGRHNNLILLPESRFSSAGTLLGRPGDLLGENTELVLTSSEDVRCDRLMKKKISMSAVSAMGMKS